MIVELSSLAKVITTEQQTKESFKDICESLFKDGYIPHDKYGFPSDIPNKQLVDSYKSILSERIAETIFEAKDELLEAMGGSSIVFFVDKRTKLFYFISDKVLLDSLLLSYSLGEVGEEESLSEEFFDVSKQSLFN